MGNNVSKQKKIEYAPKRMDMEEYIKGVDTPHEEYKINFKKDKEMEDVYDEIEKMIYQ